MVLLSKAGQDVFSYVWLLATLLGLIAVLSATGLAMSDGSKSR